MPISRREEANALIAGCLYNTAALTALREQGRIREDELKALLTECCSNLEWLLRWRDEHPEEYGVVLRKAAQGAPGPPLHLHPLICSDCRLNSSPSHVTFWPNQYKDHSLALSRHITMHMRRRCCGSLQMNLQAIETFLKSAFSEAELRRFITRLPDGHTLVTGLPGPGTPVAELAHQAVELLHRQQRLDVDLFVALKEAVPARSSEIAALAASASTSRRPRAVSSEQPTGRVQVRHDVVAGGVGIQVKAAFNKNVEIEQRVICGGTGVVLGDD